MKVGIKYSRGEKDLGAQVDIQSNKNCQSNVVTKSADVLQQITRKIPSMSEKVILL